MIRQGTKLSSRWVMEFLPSGWPAIRKIDLSDVIDVVYVIEHICDISSPLPKHRIRNTVSQKKYIVDQVDPRYEWAEEFLVSETDS